MKAFARAGLKEIAQVLPAFPEGVRPVEEPGLVGNLTPQEILSDKQRLDSVLDGYAARGRLPRVALAVDSQTSASDGSPDSPGLRTAKAGRRGLVRGGEGAAILREEGGVQTQVTRSDGDPWRRETASGASPGSAFL